MKGKHGAWASVPRIDIKSQACACNPRTGKAETGSPFGSLADQPGLLVSCRPVRDYLG